MSTPMTCEQFDDAMMDELYGELDASGSAAVAAHAAGCEGCAAKLAKLRTTRARLGSLEIAPPGDMEAKILAAAAAAEAAMAHASMAPSNVIALPTAHHAPAPYGTAGAPGPRPAEGGGGAKIFGFLSRPQFAAAAVVILVFGAAALTTMSMSMKRSPSASSADNAAAPAAQAQGEAPAQVAASAAPAAEPAAAASAAATVALASPPPPPAATMPGGALALGGEDRAAPPSDLASGLARKAPRPAAAAPPAAPVARPTSGRSIAAPDFDSAKRLADAGRCAEALPALEELALTDPRADLLAARCVKTTRGCGAATSRYAAVATRNAGNATGAAAERERQQCQAALDKAESKPGTPAATTHAKPAKPEPTNVLK